jgi:hypothetical protein
MEPLRMVDSSPAGPGAGVLVGLVAGGLVFAAWVNDLLLGVAVGGIVAALAVCMAWAVPQWHRFGVGMLVGAVVGVVLAAVVWSVVGPADDSAGAAGSGGETTARSLPCTISDLPPASCPGW